jgi:FkbM family methyltransferase
VRPFEFRIMAASDRSGSEILYVPMYGRLPLTGEASFSREQALNPYWLSQQFGPGSGRKCDVHEVEVQLRPIDELDLPAPGWVKIDVEGAEEQVLRGMQNLLAAHRPVLLVENNAMRDAWMPLITELGYGVHRCESGTRRLLPWGGEEAQNLLFLPDEIPAV